MKAQIESLYFLIINYVMSRNDSLKWLISESMITFSDLRHFYFLICYVILCSALFPNSIKQSKSTDKQMFLFSDHVRVPAMILYLWLFCQWLIDCHWWTVIDRLSHQLTALTTFTTSRPRSIYGQQYPMSRIWVWTKLAANMVKRTIF